MASFARLSGLSLESQFAACALRYQVWPPEAGWVSPYFAAAPERGYLAYQEIGYENTNNNYQG